jgi:hypothetical protein
MTSIATDWWKLLNIDEHSFNIWWTFGEHLNIWWNHTIKDDMHQGLLLIFKNHFISTVVKVETPPHHTLTSHHIYLCALYERG